MARNFDITSANATISLVCSLYPAGMDFENFASNGGWAQELIQQLEAIMGSDGQIAFGVTPSIKNASFMFQANSPTIPKLNNVVQTQDVTKQPVICQMTVNLPSIGSSIIMQNGAITNASYLPNAERVLQPSQYDFAFESMNINPIS